MASWASYPHFQHPGLLLGDDVPILSVHLSDGPQLSQTREDLIQLRVGTLDTESL